jgi:hypothetical protein
MDDYGIIKLQNVAYVNSQIASAMIELEAMKAENMQREHMGQSMAWDESSFTSLIDKYQLGHNSVLTNLQNGL